VQKYAFLLRNQNVFMVYIPLFAIRKKDV
jgi:hypothetical protein